MDGWVLVCVCVGRLLFASDVAIRPYTQTLYPAAISIRRRRVVRSLGPPRPITVSLFLAPLQPLISSSPVIQERRREGGSLLLFRVRNTIEYTIRVAIYSDETWNPKQ